MEEVYTAKDMMEFLSNFNPETPICHIGNFGETIDVKVCFTTLIGGEKVIQIEVPYLGEYPD